MNGGFVRCAVGIGLAGGIAGLYVYSFMTPASQRHIQRSIRKTVNELKDIADEISDSIKHLG